jgi:SnoaL-like domain
MLKWNWMTLVAAALGGTMVLVIVQTQRSTSGTEGGLTLTAQDYFEIQQLANRYPYLINTCDGEAYADLYAEDGVFIDRWSNDGLKEGGIRWQGRDKLMEAAGSGPLECNKSGLISYMTTNHMITPLPDGTAKGIVYTLASGGRGTPDVMHKNDPYMDLYVKTPKGWRFKERAHVRDKNRPPSAYTEGVYPLDDPRGPARGDNRRRRVQ